MFNDFGFYLETVYRRQGVDRYNYEKHYDRKKTEIIQVYSGSGVVLAGERAISMEAGAIYIINGNYFHSFQPKEPSSYIRNKIIIDTEKLYSLLLGCGLDSVIKALNDDGALFYSLNQAAAEKIDGLFLTASTLLNSDDDYSLLGFCEVLFSLLRIVLSSGSDFTQNGTPFLKKVTDFIKANLNNKITLDDICRELYFSKSYLCHEFKKQTTLTLNEYITRLKISEAIKLLSLTNKTITEIAMETGFESSSHFCQVFKRFTSLSPSSYRKKK
jgi:AraC-like DNA-binding protein